MSSGFNQALLGKHSMHFMKIRKCPHCGKCHDRDTPERDDILLHNLFECTKWHSERSTWLSNIEHDFKSLKLPDPLMNTTILNILKQSTSFPIERFCSKNIIHLVAFGGHTISKKFGKLVVTRREKKRLKVSTVVSYHTACFLHCIYKKMCNTECYQTHNALSGSAQCRSSPPG